MNRRICLLSTPACSAANNYPVILVHGFLGFGPEQFQHSGFNYWGGYGDIASQMQISAAVPQAPESRCLMPSNY